MIRIVATADQIRQLNQAADGIDLKHAARCVRKRVAMMCFAPVRDSGPRVEHARSGSVPMWQTLQRT